MNKLSVELTVSELRAQTMAHCEELIEAGDFVNAGKLATWADKYFNMEVMDKAYEQWQREKREAKEL